MDYEAVLNNIYTIITEFIDAGLAAKTVNYIAELINDYLCFIIR